MCIQEEKNKWVEESYKGRVGDKRSAGFLSHLQLGIDHSVKLRPGKDHLKEAVEIIPRAHSGPGVVCVLISGSR